MFNVFLSAFSVLEGEALNIGAKVGNFVQSQLSIRIKCRFLCFFVGVVYNLLKRKMA